MIFTFTSMVGKLFKRPFKFVLIRKMHSNSSIWDSVIKVCLLWHIIVVVQECGDSGSRILYGLYAVVVHHGRTLHSGHYVAYVKSRPAKKQKGSAIHHDAGEQDKGSYNEQVCNEGQWYHTSDTEIHKCHLNDVQRSKAYILFYELLPKL